MLCISGCTITSKMNRKYILDLGGWGRRLLGVNIVGTARSADLGSSSKYSREEACNEEEFHVNNSNQHFSITIKSTFLVKISIH